MEAMLVLDEEVTLFLKEVQGLLEKEGLKFPASERKIKRKFVRKFSPEYKRSDLPVFRPDLNLTEISQLTE